MNNPCPNLLLRQATLRILCCLALIGFAAEQVPAQELPELLAASDVEIKSDDLIRLTTSYTEAVQEYRTAELRQRTLEALRASANLSGLEVQIAQINLEAARSKLQVLQAIGEKMLALASTRAAFLRRLEQEGNLPPPAGSTASPRLRQAEADLRILKMILDLNPLQAAPQQ